MHSGLVLGMLSYVWTKWKRVAWVCGVWTLLYWSGHKWLTLKQLHMQTWQLIPHDSRVMTTAGVDIKGTYTSHRPCLENFVFIPFHFHQASRQSLATAALGVIKELINQANSVCNLRNAAAVSFWDLHVGSSWFSVSLQWRQHPTCISYSFVHMSRDVVNYSHRIPLLNRMRQTASKA